MWREHHGLCAAHHHGLRDRLPRGGRGGAVRLQRQQLAVEQRALSTPAASIFSGTVRASQRPPQKTQHTLLVLVGRGRSGRI